MPLALINTVPDPRAADKVRLPIGRAFEDWEISDGRSVIQWLKQRRLTEQGFEANRLIVEAHDHLMDMGGWVGPDGGSDMETRTRLKANVTRQFTPVDVIAEVLDNVANALLGTEASVSFTPLEPAEPGSTAEAAQQEEADAMLNVLSGWWDRRRLWELARLATKRARTYTWGTLRAWIPQATMPDVGVLQEPAAPAAPTTDNAIRVIDNLQPLDSGLTFADALMRIQVSAPPAEQGYLYTDPDTQQQVAIFLWASGTDEFMELAWVDPEDGLTHMRQVSGTTAEDTEVTLDLGGRLPLTQMECDLLITEPVRMQQARLNFVESMMVRVMEQAGFPERIFKNAKPNGIWSPTAPASAVWLDTQIVDGVTYYLIPAPRTLGASITTELRGLDKRDPLTNQIVGVETPDAMQFAPTDPTYAITLARHARATILRQCKQGHLEMDDQTAPSGFARLVAKAPFIADVENNRPPLEGMLRDLLDCVIRMASMMSNEFAGFLDRYRIGVTAHVNTGPVSPEEQSAVLEQVKTGVLSQETALEFLGVEDTAAELDRLRGEPQAKLTMLLKQFEAMNAGITTGLQLTTVAKLAEFNDEQMALIEGDATAVAGSPENTGVLQVQDQRAPGLGQPGSFMGLQAIDDQPNMNMVDGGQPPTPQMASLMAAIDALSKQVTALQSQVAAQQTTINSPVSVSPAPVTINNGPQGGAVAPRRMVRVKKLEGGNFIGEIVTDPEQVTMQPAPGGAAGEITGVTAA